MPRRRPARYPDFEAQVILLLQGGPVSWGDVELDLAKAAIGLIEKGRVELITVNGKSHLRLVEEEGEASA